MVVHINIIMDYKQNDGQGFKKKHCHKETIIKIIQRAMSKTNKIGIVGHIRIFGRYYSGHNPQTPKELYHLG